MSEILTRQLARRDDLVAQASRLVDDAEIECRALTPSEAATHAALLSDLASCTQRIGELEHAARRDAAADEARRQAGEVNMTLTGRVPATIGYEPTTYRRGGDRSYVQDLFDARVNGSRDAIDALVRNDRENRALSNDGGAGGAAGEWAPPAWLVADFVALARPGRPVADAVMQMPLKPGISSVNLPRVASGTAVDVQAAQHTALADTDLTSDSVSSPITTIGGKQVVSQQLLDQSGTNLDEVIFGDLMGEYFRALDTQVLSGTGASGQLRGLLGVSGITSLTYTDASPSVAGAGKFYAMAAKLIATTNAARFAPLTCLVMRPERWGWLQASFDLQDRPLYLPTGDQGPQNAAGILDRVAAEAVVGHMHGLPVLVDANLPVTSGTDVVVGLRASDLWLYSSEVRMEAFTAPAADTLGVLLRLYAYHAFLPDRQPKSIAVLGGTGMAFPPAY